MCSDQGECQLWTTRVCPVSGTPLSGGSKLTLVCLVLCRSSCLIGYIEIQQFNTLSYGFVQERPMWARDYDVWCTVWVMNQPYVLAKEQKLSTKLAKIVAWTLAAVTIIVAIIVASGIVYGKIRPGETGDVVKMEPVANPILLEIMERSDRCGDIYPIRNTYRNTQSKKVFGFDVPITGTSTSFTVTVESRSCIDLTKMVVKHAGATVNPAPTDQITFYVPHSKMETPRINDAESDTGNPSVQFLAKALNLFGTKDYSDEVRKLALDDLTTMFPQERMNTNLEKSISDEYRNLLAFAGFTNINIVFTDDLPTDGYKPVAGPPQPVKES